MGDRNNPIKFGPEWLRNMPRERSAAVTTSSPNSQVSSLSSATATASGSATGASASSPSSATASSSVSTTTSNTSTGATARVQLAKLRYGREEMLALYDRTSEAPTELKYIDFLYQPRGKPPIALNNNFEEEMSANTRSGAPMGPSGERFGTGRGRIPNSSDTRGRSRMPFVRQVSAGRSTSWHLGASPRNLYNTGTDEESPQRPSWNNTNGGNVTNRTSGEQTDWNGSKVFRSKRQGPATNWRQAREGSDEWRSPDAGRSRNSTQQDKWERDWGDRPNQDKQPWNSNRRTWVGSDSQNNDDLPEWAVDGTEACGGTFDSSGAFHGYSNDDTNLPKNQDSSYPLARSHTHGSFARSKTVEEGSDEWWASEKAKKLSPKRFDASDIKFKKLATTALPVSSPSSRVSTKTTSSKEEAVETPEKTEASPDPENNKPDDEKRKINQQFSESKTFDALMRSDIDLEEANDERGNFQSVMITPNNSLRQKHQNIVSTPDIQNRISTPDIQNRKPIYHMLPTPTQMKYSESDYDSRVHSTNEDKIVEEIMDMTMEDKEILSLSNIITTKAVTTASMMMNSPSVSMPLGMPPNVNSMAQITNSAMHMRISSPLHPNQGLAMNKPNMPAGMQGQGLQTTGLQQTGITNSALNASLGLPIGPSGGATMGLTMQGIPPPLLSNSGMANPGIGGIELSAGLGAGPMQANTSGIQFPTGGTIPGLSTSNMSNSSLFLNQNTSNNSIPNHGNQGNIFPMHGLQHSGSQAPFIASMYGNMMQSTPPQLPPSAQNLSEQWYYEDPKKTVQGPFSSTEMYNWYRAGFFTPSLMVRRACDTHMIPLGSFGSAPPFAQPEMMSPYPMSSAFEPRSQVPLNSQPGLVLESVDSLWSPPSPAPDMLWMQQAMTVRNENRVNNLPMFFWDQQPTAMTTSTLLPEDIAKEMKTEDQILAQMRASHNISTHPNIPYMSEPPPPAAALAPNKPENFPATENITPKLEELQKLMQKDIMIPKPPAEPNVQNKEPQANVEIPVKVEQTAPEHIINKSQQQIQHKITIDPKVAAKQAKNESEKSKTKETVTKSKTKKAKEDKKEENEVKNDDEVIEKRSAEPSPSKTKKEEKANKKELEKEKKEWLKEGFTIVKGSEKNNNKEIKKKAEEAKASEEAERKRKEDDKLAAEEERKRKQIEALKKQQEQQQQQRQISESVVKKAPWSAVTSQSMQATSKDGLTLAEIQRLEREKKLEQMKEQQQMMQIIAQQQAAALAREQEMQAGLGWAKKKGVNTLNMPGQSLAEIQAEARKQQAVAAAGAAAAAASQALEEAQAAQQAQINLVPWGNTHNGGFWDTQPNAIPKTIEKQPEPTKMPELKPKKKPTVIVTPKKEASPAAEFEIWCTTVLASYSSKIDVPTFVGFLKDIESPYEVKDYVKCYLGESKDSGDFARQFLERRSKLLRVGMVTPSDDLCSPAIAVNPRTISGSDYQEVKGKGKKTKKNKMLKVDARILGFSVTASEDRINVGDIDTV